MNRIEVMGASYEAFGLIHMCHDSFTCAMTHSQVNLNEVMNASYEAFGLAILREDGQILEVWM